MCIYIYVTLCHLKPSPELSVNFCTQTFQCVQVLLPVELCEVQGRVSDHQTLGARYLAQVPMWDGGSTDSASWLGMLELDMLLDVSEEN